MKKFFLFAITLTMITSVSMAAKHEAPAAIKVSSSSNKATAPAVSSAVSMAELMKENQALKTALLKATTENESLSNQLSFSQNMFFATTALYEVELKKQDEKAKNEAAYAWLMNSALTTLAALPKEA